MYSRLVYTLEVFDSKIVVENVFGQQTKIENYEIYEGFSDYVQSYRCLWMKGENYIKEEHQKEFLKLTKELIILSREETGNISYHLYQDIHHLQIDNSLLVPSLHLPEFPIFQLFLFLHRI